MTESTPDFSLEIEGVAGVCPAGEAYAKQNIAEGNIPVLCCEGPCIRGEIARLATNMVAEEAPVRPLLLCGDTFGAPLGDGDMGKRRRQSRCGGRLFSELPRQGHEKSYR